MLYDFFLSREQRWINWKTNDILMFLDISILRRRIVIRGEAIGLVLEQGMFDGDWIIFEFLKMSFLILKKSLTRLL